MSWILASKIVAGIITAVIFYKIYKELKDMIRRDKRGETSGRCELD